MSSFLKTSSSSIIARKTVFVSRYLPRANAAAAARSTSSRHGNDPDVCFLFQFSWKGGGGVWGAAAYRDIGGALNRFQWIMCLGLHNKTMNFCGVCAC